MTDAKLYVDRVTRSVGIDTSSCIQEVVFGVSGDLPYHGGADARPGSRPAGSSFSLAASTKPDPFAPPGSRMLSALDATPAHLARERWPAAKVASQLTFRLEQMGTSLDCCMRNFERLCVALKAGQFRHFKLHALTTVDLQKVAAAWGLVVDKAQARELFELRGLSPDAPVLAAAFVRAFIAPLNQSAGLLDSSRPRSHARAPPIDYGGGDGPYSGGRANLVELSRTESYKTVGDRRRVDLQTSWQSRSSSHLLGDRPARADDARPGARGGARNVPLLHERMLASGMLTTDVAIKTLRLIGLGAEKKPHGNDNVPLSPAALRHVASRLGVSLADEDVAWLLGEFAPCSTTQFVLRFLNTTLKPSLG